MVKPLKYKSKKRGLSSGAAVKLLGVLRGVLLRSFPYIVSLTTLGILFGGVVAYAVNSPTFELQEVRLLNMGTLTPEQAFRFSELQRGENLIHLDLVNVQQVIKKNHPEFKEVRVRRVLPNRVEILLKRRTPAAQALFSRYVQVDKDMVVLPGSSTAPFRNLTILEGAPLPRTGLFVGTTLNDGTTQKALRLMDVIKRSGVLKKHVLTKIDIGDPKNFSLFVDGTIEIKIGNSHFIERLRILDQTLRTLELDPAHIRYIDLRFDDVVVGPR
jgi:cell division septal protein FtsQ